MIREDSRGRRVAIVADFLINKERQALAATKK